MLLDPHYQDPRLVALYDIDSGWSKDRQFYLDLAGDAPIDILDLGCGTGLVCNAYAAKGHRVVGADPAQAMLDSGRQKQHGGAIEWVCAPAQAFRSDKRFDLIIMTGHAFQVLMNDPSVAAALYAVQLHLKPGGRFVFESRNPAHDWAARWEYAETLTLPDGGTVRETRTLKTFDGEFMTFDLGYEFADSTHVSPSALRFMPASAITAALNDAGLKVDKLLGDWDGRAFDAAASPEIIVFASLK